MLEGVATTYSDTETIVNGGKVMNMSVNDVTKVINLKHSWEFILDENVIAYPTNYVVLCEINGIVGVIGHEETLGDDFRRVQEIGN
jgi:hypothetical protein